MGVIADANAVAAAMAEVEGSPEWATALTREIKDTASKVFLRNKIDTRKERPNGLFFHGYHD